MKDHLAREDSTISQAVTPISLEDMSALPQDVNLRRRFPPALRSIFADSVPWIVIYLLVLLLLDFTYREWDSQFSGELLGSFYIVFSAALILTGLVVCLGKLVYEYIYHRSYRYGIEAGHLVISKGLLVKTRGSFPLGKISDVYIDREFIDLIFGLCTLHVRTPSHGVADFAGIRGLATNTAVHLQDYLTKLVQAANMQSETLSSPPPPEAIGIPSAKPDPQANENAGPARDVKANSR